MPVNTEFHTFLTKVVDATKNSNDRATKLYVHDIAVDALARLDNNETISLEEQTELSNKITANYKAAKDWLKFGSA